MYIADILPEKGVFLVAAIHWLLAVTIVETHILPHFENYMFIVFGISTLTVYYSFPLGTDIRFV